ncbi:MAG: hypothetical protein II306_00955 [Clostridia bacterium]|nr:hypothetical protein [Clostridia bacterium]MEE1024593.1 hypothetical protein [Acutalibacteraceae bacterium]
MFKNKRLKMLIDARRIPHTILIEGERANDEALLTAKACVCSGKMPPCGVCSHCIKATSSNHPDIILYKPSSKHNPYKIETVRKLRQDAYIKPNEAMHKVYIISDADDISVQSQNALLKILEEPPSYAVFIITCNSKNKLLETIISRAAFFTAKGDAVINEKAAEVANDIASKVLSKNELELYFACNSISGSGVHFIDVANELCRIFREVYIAKYTETPTCSTAKMLADKVSLKTALGLLNAADCAKRACEHNANAALNTVRLCAALRQAAGK